MSKHLNTNRQFMVGNGILAFAVIMVVVIFLYMSYRLKSDIEQHYTEEYSIVLDGFKNNAYRVEVNDSIIFDGEIEVDQLQINVRRFAEESAALITNLDTEQVNIFDLDDKGGSYKFKLVDGKIQSELIKK